MRRDQTYQKGIVHRDSGAKGTHRLQNVSSEAEETGKTSSGASDSLVGGTGEGGWLGSGGGGGSSN
jgi:hypothetical protein